MLRKSIEPPMIVFFIRFLTFLGFGRGLHVTDLDLSLFYPYPPDLRRVVFVLVGGLKGLIIGLGVGSLF